MRRQERSTLFLGDFESRGEHRFICEVSCDCVVDVEEKVREASSEVREETSW